MYSKLSNSRGYLIRVEVGFFLKLNKRGAFNKHGGVKFFQFQNNAILIRSENSSTNIYYEVQKYPFSQTFVLNFLNFRLFGQ